MAFDVAAEAYGRFMGRWSEPLADRFTALVDLGPGRQALDVGCGPGALTGRLVAALGERSVVAVDPSPPFVAAVRARHPGVDVRRATAEHLPWRDDAVDVTLAQLVVHFMTDPAAGVAEMVRVTRPGGAVGACVWDHAGDGGPLTVFWRAARELDPTATGEADLPGTRRGQLVTLLEGAGLADVREHVLTVERTFPTVEDWWDPFTLGVGPAGDHVARLDDDARAVLRARCAALLPEPPFTLTARAWAAVGTVPD